MDYTNIISYVEERNFSGAIDMKSFSKSSIYRWTRELNRYLEKFHYSWRVKPNCKNQTIEIVR